MGYLMQSDYNRQIQPQNLTAIIAGLTTTQTAMEQAAIEIVQSYLRQKYDVTTEFMSFAVWNPATIYQAKNRVYLDAPAYNSGSTYTIGTLTLQAGNVYQCSTAIGTPESFTPAHWTLLGPEFQMYYAALPQYAPFYSSSSTYTIGTQVIQAGSVYQCSVAINTPESFNPAHWTLLTAPTIVPEFNLATGTYNKGDKVYWKNNIYTCQQSTLTLDHTTIFQSEFQANIPASNVFPDDPVNGQTFWGTPTPYTVPANTPITNTTYWIQGDSRTQLIVICVIDIVLYHLHSRIAPQNIPELRKRRYDDAIGWLRDAAQGISLTTAMPVLQPRQGGRLRHGGNIKSNNSW